MSSRILVSLRVAASADRAFAVFTQEIGLWWRTNTLFHFTRGPAGTLSLEPGLGGRLLEIKPDGSTFEIGRVTDWEPGAKLGLTWRQESFEPGQMTHVAVRFEPAGDETRVTVEHRGWDTVPIEHAARHRIADGLFLKWHGEWWQTLLAAFRGRLG